jgi:hypothetical protein
MLIMTKMSKKNNVRSSQLLSPFGVGQIVNFPEELSVMVCGLNLWDEQIAQGKINRGINSISEEELRFNETRLQKVLGVNYFVKPFEYKTSGAKNNYLKIPAVRFPGWHYCTNSKCGRMREVPLGQANKRIECQDQGCHNGKSKLKSKMIPVRFVALQVIYRTFHLKNGFITDLFLMMIRDMNFHTTRAVDLVI